MTSELTEILRSLPDEQDAAGPTEAALSELLRTLATRRMPEGRLIRLWSLGTLQVRLAGYQTSSRRRCTVPAHGLLPL